MWNQQSFYMQYISIGDICRLQGPSKSCREYENLSNIK